jgi:hypothetical protein
MVVPYLTIILGRVLVLRMKRQGEDQPQCGPRKSRDADRKLKNFKIFKE